jgi:hypothetical protein
VTANEQALPSGIRATTDPSAAVALVDSATAAGLTIRLFGSVACWSLCVAKRDIYIGLRPKPIGDIDLVSRFAEKRDVESFMVEHGWRLDQDIATVPGARYSLCYRIRAGRVMARCDVHYDVLAFSHAIDLQDRLALAYPTLTVSDLLLTKLQIAKPSEADRFDMIMLLGEHAIGDDVPTMISNARIASCCAAAWGLYTTVTDNLRWIMEGAPAWTPKIADAQLIRDRVAVLQHAIVAAPKSLRWRARALLGKRMRWFDDIDPVGIAVGDML